MQPIVDAMGARLLQHEPHDVVRLDWAFPLEVAQHGGRHLTGRIGEQRPVLLHESLGHRIAFLGRDGRIAL